jgi:acetate kinase
MTTESVLAKGLVDRLGIDGTKIKHNAGGVKSEIQKPLKNHAEALKTVCDLLLDGVISNLDEVTAVGHRVVHAAEAFSASILVDDQKLKILDSISDLAPLHNPPNLACIRAAQTVFPKKPHVAVFDTAFHSTIPQKAYMYAIKYEDYEKYKIRKYGFHGTSHKYVSEIAHNLLGLTSSKIITCHLGNGSSVAAVQDGKSVDTSMGLTPLEGLIMGTRSGDIDPAVVEFLMEKKGYDGKQVMNYLNKECGLLGISGVSSDNRDVIGQMKVGNERAGLAFDMFTYRIQKYIGAYAASMGGLDAVVFTGGIGENSRRNRRKVLKGLEFMGIELDGDKNFELSEKPWSGYAEISSKESKVKVYVIQTNEELVIARETAELLG